MSGPAGSILLAVRNEERHLPAMLASLQRQTLDDWDLVAVDDGSRDRTPPPRPETPESESCPAPRLAW